MIDVLTPEQWYRLVNDIRDLAKRYNMNAVQEAVKYVEIRGLPQEKAK